MAETPLTVPGTAWPDGWSFPADEGLGPGERVGSVIRAGAGLGPWAQWVVDQALWSKRAGTRKAEVTEWSGEASLICASGWSAGFL